jgi:hypothetical protein
MFLLLRKALNAFFDDKRITITVVCVWFCIVMVIFTWLGIFSTSYMQFGPNKDLAYMGMPLDSWSRWCAVLLFVLISTAINDIAGDAISPWMANCVCDHKNRYIPYSKTTCICISQLWSVYCATMSIASIALVFSQFDLIFFRILVDLLVNQYTTTRFLENKTHNVTLYNTWFEDIEHTPEESTMQEFSVRKSEDTGDDCPGGADDTQQTHEFQLDAKLDAGLKKCTSKDTGHPYNILNTVANAKKIEKQALLTEV